MRRSLVAAVGIGLIAGAAFTAAPAFAHSQIIDSTPKAGETLVELPEEFSITANETLLDVNGGSAFALQIRDGDGRYYGDGCLTIVDARMSTPAALGSPGDYTMLWQVVSGDGHPVSGEIPFTWAPEAAFTPSPGAAEAPLCGEEPDPHPSYTAVVTDTTTSGTEAVLLVVGVAAIIVVTGAIWLVRFLKRRRRPTTTP